MIFTKRPFYLPLLKLIIPEYRSFTRLKFHHSRVAIILSEGRFVQKRDDKLIRTILNCIEIVSNRKIYTQPRDLGFLITGISSVKFNQPKLYIFYPTCSHLSSFLRGHTIYYLPMLAKKGWYPTIAGTETGVETR